jgi:hypothetical protein
LSLNDASLSKSLFRHKLCNVVLHLQQKSLFGQWGCTTGNAAMVAHST